MKTNDEYFSILKTNLPSEKSSNNYINRLKTILKLTNVSLHEILINPKKYYPIISHQYSNLNTRRNMIVPFSSIFKHDIDLHNTHLSASQDWAKYNENLLTFSEAKSKQNLISEKQKENYVSFAEIELKLLELLKEEDPHATLSKSMMVLLLAIITDITPKRSDLGNIKIYKKDPFINTENYLVLKSKNEGSSYIVLNIYKTSKFYNRYEEDLSNKFINILKQSLRRYPRAYLFINTEHKPYHENSAFGVFVQRTFFKLFGKSTGTSLLRHIYIVEKVDFSKSEEELIQIANSMLHSFDIQRKYRFVKGIEQKCICTQK